MKEPDNILRIFEEAKNAINEGDMVKLKDLSNQTVHTASIDQDPDNVAVAVIIYSLSKIIERRKYQDYPGWNKFYKNLMVFIDGSIDALTKNHEENFRRHLKDIRSSIEHLSGKLKQYINEVFRKASINKASRIYEHGISMETTASLLGITMYDLAEYAGATGISDVSLGQTLDVKSRIKYAMEMFG